MQLRAEIRTIQSQLKTAIQNHQMIVFKLKDRPVSINLRMQMSSVQRHIVHLGEKQKKLLQQLRQEMEASGGKVKVDKPSPKPLQSLMPNPLNPLVSTKSIVIKKEFELKKENKSDENTTIAGSAPVKTGTSRRKSKLVATPDVPYKNGHAITPSSSPAPSPSQKENTPSSTPSSSPPHVMNAIKPSKQSSKRTPKRDSRAPSSASEESQDASIHLPADPELRKKLRFMTALSLVTREVLTELQNRRTERKRRSTANPQFLYGNNLDQAMKRKKMIYLASTSTAYAVPLNTSASCAPPVNISTGTAVLASTSSEQMKPAANLVCLSCSSADGPMMQCFSCQKGFHWNCIFESASLSPPGDAVKCRACQELGKLTETNGMV